MNGAALHIACTADATYVPHCATMLASLLAHHEPARIYIHYLHPADLPGDTVSAITTLVRGRGAHIRCHAFDDEAVAGLPSWPGLRPVMWYRVFLAERLPDLDRVLYIDADALVLDDLGPLWDTDLADAWLAAVTNVPPPIFANHPIALGLPDRESYFNSGVMLLNLARMRREQAGPRLVAESRGRALRFWDQDGLNLAFHRNWIRLHPRWNCMNALFLFREPRDVFGAQTVAEACARPAIVHFEGPGLGKPWHFLSKHPFQANYLRYRAQTPWPLAELEGLTLRNRLLRFLPARGILEVLGLEYRMRRIAASARRALARGRRAEKAP